jgi:hypothetical protein
MRSTMAFNWSLAKRVAGCSFSAAALAGIDVSPCRFLLAHDLVRKPISTFRDHARRREAFGFSRPQVKESAASSTLFTCCAVFILSLVFSVLPSPTEAGSAKAEPGVPLFAIKR